ncbi:MAG TPA: TIGR00159 family protein [Firmicutes bacterium]|nr:TIGR00159 family protein [Bacillota bacterium]
MTLSTVWSTASKILDICILWYMVYFLLKNLKNNIKMVLIFKGIVFIIIIKLISNLLNLYTVGLLLEYVIVWGPLALIIIFQPEIRTVLEQLGRSQLLGRHKVLSGDERELVVTEIMEAVEYLRKNRFGALIAIERDVSLQEYIAPATKIYADITAQILESLFYPNSALHDGGVIIQGTKVTCAGCVFRTSMDNKLNKSLGTRHRAGLGLSEESDAIVLIVSEETGRISIAINGSMNYNLTYEEFKKMLYNELTPKTEIFYAADERGEDDE